MEVAYGEEKSGIPVDNRSAPFIPFSRAVQFLHLPALPSLSLSLPCFIFSGLLEELNQVSDRKEIENNRKRIRFGPSLLQPWSHPIPKADTAVSFAVR